MVLLALTAYWPAIDGLYTLNVNLGLAGMIGWVAIGVNDVTAGLAGGIGGVVKVFPSALSIATPNGKARALAIGVTVGALACVVTLPLVGVSSWLDFFKALPAAVPDCGAANYSVACLMQPVIGLEGGTLLGLAIAGLAVIGLVFVRQPLWMAVLCTVAVMAPATDLHPHYWLILFPVAIAALCRMRDPSTPPPKPNPRMQAEVV